MAFWVFYILCGAVFLAVGLWKNRRDGDDAQLQVFLAAFIWPAALLALLQVYLRTYRPPPDTRADDSPQYAPHSWNYEYKNRANYNDMVFGQKAQAGEKTEEDEMAAFIASIEKEPDAPLTSEVKITFGPTGAAKTYPAGTIFPRALLEDCKSGYFFRPSRPVPPQAEDE